MPTNFSIFPTFAFYMITCHIFLAWIVAPGRLEAAAAAADGGGGGVCVFVNRYNPST